MLLLNIFYLLLFCIFVVNYITIFFVTSCLNKLQFVWNFLRGQNDSRKIIENDLAINFKVTIVELQVASEINAIKL